MTTRPSSMPKLRVTTSFLYLSWLILSCSCWKTTHALSLLQRAKQRWKKPTTTSSTIRNHRYVPTQKSSHIVTPLNPSQYIPDGLTAEQYQLIQQQEAQERAQHNYGAFGPRFKQQQSNSPPDNGDWMLLPQLWTSGIVNTRPTITTSSSNTPDASNDQNANGRRFFQKRRLAVPTMILATAFTIFLGWPKTRRMILATNINNNIRVFSSSTPAMATLVLFLVLWSSSSLTVLLTARIMNKVKLFQQQRKKNNDNNDTAD